MGLVNNFKDRRCLDSMEMVRIENDEVIWYGKDGRFWNYVITSRMEKTMWYVSTRVDDDDNPVRSGG